MIKIRNHKLPNIYIYIYIYIYILTHIREREKGEGEDKTQNLRGDDWKKALKPKSNRDNFNQCEKIHSLFGTEASQVKDDG
jgi:hypothetical protein